MNCYKIMPQGRESYMLEARSITHARAFTRHWPRVVIRRMVLVRSVFGLEAWATAGWVK